MQVDDLLNQLHTRGGFELVNQSTTETQARLMGRVHRNAMGAWLILVQNLLLRSGQGWSVDISKQYFLRDGRVVYAWRLIFQGKELERAMPDICQTIINAPRAKSVIEEQPLVGARANRNAPNAKGKGAQGVLTAAVGPMAVAQAQFLAGGGGRVG